MVKFEKIINSKNKITLFKVSPLNPVIILYQLTMVQPPGYNKFWGILITIFHPEILKGA